MRFIRVGKVFHEVREKFYLGLFVVNSLLMQLCSAILSLTEFLMRVSESE